MVCDFHCDGATLGVWLACKEAPRRGLTSDDVIDFILWAFPIGLIGVRAYYVAFQWDYYSQHPSEIIALWDGGGAIYGGLIAGAIVLFVFSYYRMINPLDLLDISITWCINRTSFWTLGKFCQSGSLW